MKKILLSLVLSTVFAAASTDVQASQEGRQGGVTLVEPAANNADSSASQASELNADKSTAAAKEQQNPPPPGTIIREPRESRIAFLDSYPKASRGVDFTVSALAAAWEGIKEHVAPHVFTCQFAFGLVTGLTTAYFALPACK